MTGLGSPCGACKFLRRKCVRGCVFAPFFCHEQGAAHFAAIHKVFGASNFSKLLLHVPVSDRSEAAVTMAYEAQARLQDPVYGCISHIFALQQQVYLLIMILHSCSLWVIDQFMFQPVELIGRSSICKLNWSLSSPKQLLEGSTKLLHLKAAVLWTSFRPSSSKPVMAIKSGTLPIPIAATPRRSTSPGGRRRDRPTAPWRKSKVAVGRRRPGTMTWRTFNRWR